MPLLADYAVTPDVFDKASYSCDEVCRLHLREIRDVLLAEGLLRDLRDGNWSQVLREDGRDWHPAKGLVGKMVRQGRLVKHPCFRPTAPGTDVEWCEEALACHSSLPLLGGVIVTESVKEEHKDEPIVARIDRLSMTPWWRDRSPSARLERTRADYRAHLSPVLQHANSVMFIDPHLDPALPRYRALLEVILLAAGRSPPPLIEVHRVVYHGGGRGRVLYAASDLTTRFLTAWGADLRAAGLSVEVKVWDDFHDRYLISNLVGIQVPNGFDTSNDPSQQITTWVRLGAKDRDDVQREFDPASHRHSLRYQFSVP